MAGFDAFAAGSESVFGQMPAPVTAPITTENAFGNIFLRGIEAVENVLIAQKTGKIQDNKQAIADIAQPMSSKAWVPWVVGIGLVALVVSLSK